MLAGELETLTDIIDTYNFELESMITPESLHS